MPRRLKRVELFRIRSLLRRFDRASGKFIINIAYETAPPKPTKRVVEVSEGFGLGLDQWEKFVVCDNVELKIGLDPPDVVYITGDSGSGKSVLLRALEQDLRNDLHVKTVNINRVRPKRGVPLVETLGRSTSEAIELLSKVGLNDAFLFLQTFEHLSDGQKFRYKVAKMLESDAKAWVFDEFCSTLDRDTAKVVAYNLQKLARACGKMVLAATTHTDLADDLKPSVQVFKRFGSQITVTYSPPSRWDPGCSLTREMQVNQGSMQDWKQLARFHYRSHHVPSPRRIFALKRGEELCGVVVYSFPSPACFGRKQVMPHKTMRELNRDLSTITRIVVHPKYRTIGLGAKLIKETLAIAGTPDVELIAVMAKYNPFAEKAGMRRICVQDPPRHALRVAEKLKDLGFDLQLLGSRNYVLDKLQMLPEGDVSGLRRVFARAAHVRFLKEFNSGKAFDKKSDYAANVLKADAGRIAGLVRIAGFLLQTKVYLFWHKS